MSYILGLDLSLRSPGICIRDESTQETHWTLFAQRKHQTPGKYTWGNHSLFLHPLLPADKYQCIHTIVNTLDHVVQMYHPREAYIEGYAYGITGSGQSSSQSTLCELGGCVRLLLHKAGVPFVEYAPQSIKRLFAGKGGATKEDMVGTWRETYRPSIVPQDLSLHCAPHQSPLHDAIDAYALTHVASLEKTLSNGKKQQKKKTTTIKKRKKSTTTTTTEDTAVTTKEEKEEEEAEKPEIVLIHKKRKSCGTSYT